MAVIPSRYFISKGTDLGYDEFHFETQVSQVVDLLDANQKISIGWFPTDFMTGMRKISNITGTATLQAMLGQIATWMLAEAPVLVGHQDTQSGLSMVDYSGFVEQAGKTFKIIVPAFTTTGPGDSTSVGEFFDCEFYINGIQQADLRITDDVATSGIWKDSAVDLGFNVSITAETVHGDPFGAGTWEFTIMPSPDNSYENYVGKYFQCTDVTVLTGDANHVLLAPGDEGDTDITTGVTLETGDWVEYAGYNDTDSVHEWVIVNYTYRDATAIQKGIVKLSDVALHDNLDGSGASKDEVITEEVLKAVLSAVDNPAIIHIAKTDGTDNPHGLDYGDVGAEQANANIQTHIGMIDGNPHEVEAADLGLENVGNYGFADIVATQAGTSTILYMNPARTKDAIDFFSKVNVVGTLPATGSEGPEGRVYIVT